MMTHVFLFLLAALDGGTVKFNTLRSLEVLPDDLEYFMEEPIAFEVDKNGNYYVLDGGAKTIFVWDVQGKFVRTIGKEGQGPGELVLQGRGPASGYLTMVNDQLFVMDNAKRKLMIFNPDGTFVKDHLLPINRGRMINFAVMKEGEYFIHRRRRGDNNIMVEVLKSGDDGKALKTYISQPDDTFKISGGSGGRRNFQLTAFNTQMVSHVDVATGQVLMGFSGEPTFKVINSDGTTRTIKVPLTREEITAADKEEYEQIFASSRRRPTIKYPDKKPFFTHLLSMGKQGFLVFQQSPFYRKIVGVHINTAGKPIGRFVLNNGEQGGLMAARGQVLNVVLNDDDEFQLQEMNVL